MRSKANWGALALLVVIFLVAIIIALPLILMIAPESMSPKSHAKEIWLAQMMFVSGVVIAISAAYLTAAYVRSADIVFVIAIFLGLLLVLPGAFVSSVLGARGVADSNLEIATVAATLAKVSAPFLGGILGGLTAMYYLAKKRETSLRGRKLRNFMIVWVVIIIAAIGGGYGYTYVQAAQFLAHVNEMEIRAEAGDREAQMDLGHLYRGGGKAFSGVGKDFEEAIKWFSLAADAGSSETMELIATIYDEELEDWAAAAKWYLRAAEAGSSWSQFKLGELYYRGQGVDEDLAGAIDWWIRAAVNGGKKARIRLGEIYENGEGVPKDAVRAYMWHLLSADRLEYSPGMRRLAAVLTANQMAEAGRLADEWRRNHESAEEPRQAPE